MGRSTTNDTRDKRLASNPKLVVVGYTNIDINITPSGKTILPGGSAYFTAIAASRIMQPIGLVSRIGYDFDPTFLLSRVLAEGIRRVPHKKTATSIQTYTSESDYTQRDIKLIWGVAPSLCPQDMPIPWLSSAEWIHIATMPPIQQKKFISFFTHAAPHAILSLDTDVFLLKKDDATKTAVEENIKRVHFVFVNRKEYAIIKSTVNQCADAIVKCDQEGAYYLHSGKKRFHIPTHRIVVKDATGAGDILAGTFLACHLTGQPLNKSLRQATEIATQSVTEVGVRHLFSAKT